MITSFITHNSTSTTFINNKYVYLALRFVNLMVQISCLMLTDIKLITRKEPLSMKSAMNISRITSD